MATNLNNFVPDWPTSHSCENAFVFPREHEVGQTKTIVIQIGRHISIRCILSIHCIYYIICILSVHIAWELKLTAVSHRIHWFHLGIDVRDERQLFSPANVYCQCTYSTYMVCVYLYILQLYIKYIYSIEERNVVLNRLSALFSLLCASIT